MDETLLAALDRAAKKGKRDRSKLVREAVARFLASEEARERDRRVIEGYRKQPLSREELGWLSAGEWPKE